MGILKTNHKYFTAAISVLLAFLSTMAPFAIDTYLAAMPDMAQYFGVEFHFIELTLTVYFLGFAFGNFIGGPFSDAFGRKTVALFGVLLYAVTAFAITFCTQIEWVWLLRVFQAFGGGLASVTAMVFVRDWYEGKQVARLATIVGMIAMMAPMFAPIVGSFLMQFNGWITIFQFLAVYAAFVFLLFLFFVPESRAKNLINRDWAQVNLLAKYRLFFANKTAVLALFAVGFSVAGMFTVITNASFMYLEYFGVSQAVFPILFGANIGLNVVLSVLNTFLLKITSPVKLLNTALKIQLFSAVIVAIAIFMGNPPLWIVFVCVMFYVGSLGLVFGNGTAVILNFLPEISGSANAMIGVVRFALGFAVGSLLAIFHTGDLLPFATIFLFCAITSNVIFYFFYKRVK